MLKFGISVQYTEISAMGDYIFSRYGLNDQEVYKKLT